MQELGLADGDEVVLAFLQAEIDAADHAPHLIDLLNRLHYDRSLIDYADLGDAHANCARAVILGAHRGYGRSGALFENFPNDTTWRRVSLNLDEIGRLKFVHIQAFVELSSTRSVAEGARNYRENPDTAAKVDAIQEKISRGVSFPEFVLVEDAQKQLVIIEGNHRAIAYTVAGVEVRISALIGRSPTMHQWRYI